MFGFGKINESVIIKTEEQFLKKTALLFFIKVCGFILE